MDIIKQVIEEMEREAMEAIRNLSPDELEGYFLPCDAIVGEDVELSMLGMYDSEFTPVLAGVGDRQPEEKIMPHDKILIAYLYSGLIEKLGDKSFALYVVVQDELDDGSFAELLGHTRSGNPLVWHYKENILSIVPVDDDAIPIDVLMTIIKVFNYMGRHPSPGKEMDVDKMLSIVSDFLWDNPEVAEKLFPAP